MNTLEEEKKFLMTKSVYNNETEATYWFRENPVETSDTGWRIIGYADQKEYIDDPQNWLIVEINEILEKCTLGLEIIKAQIGTDLIITYNDENEIAEIYDVNAEEVIAIENLSKLY